MIWRGSLCIDVATLRKLLPLWMRGAGFVVDDSEAVSGEILVDASVPSFGEYEINSYIKDMLSKLRITDGGMSSIYDERRGVVRILVSGGAEQDRL